MGRDKAMLELEGRTLLARTVLLLREVAAFKSLDTEVVVTICGERDRLEGADRAIADRYAACGPLGGMEAALNDLNREGSAEWALFLPVDMPLLTAEAVSGLLAEWIKAIANDESLRAGLVDADGRVQPLISLVHRSLHAQVEESLEMGRYKVAPLLQAAPAVLLHYPPAPETSVSSPRREDELEETYAAFTNVNTEADLMGVATFMRRLGSKR